MAKVKVYEANVTVSEFLSGEPLRYAGYEGPMMLATYRVGDGIYVETKKGEDVCKADVVTDIAARRFYENVTRRAQSE